MKLEAASVVERTAERRRRSGGRVARLGAVGFVSFYVVSFGLELAGGGGGLLAMIATFGAAAAASSGVAALAGAVGYLAASSAEPEPLGPGSATVDGRAMIVTTPRGGAWKIRRTDLEAGWLEDDAHAVVRTSDGTELCFHASGDADAISLLRALELAADERVVSFPIESAARGTSDEAPLRSRTLLSALLAVLGLACASIFNAGFFLGATSFAPHALASTALAVGGLAGLRRGAHLLDRRQAIVGTDGIAVDGARRRFIPSASIASAEVVPGGVRLALSSDESVVLPAARGGEGLARRIEEILAARGRSRAKASLAASLERGTSSIRDWQRRLAANASREEGYREARLGVRDLADVVEDGAAPVERRIGAALSIAAAGDASLRSRVRLAAQASTDADLRAALEEASAGEVEEARLARLSARSA